MNKSDIEIVWIDGCEQWIRKHRIEGWVACYLNFMFEPLHGSTAAIIEQMKDAIHREFYVPFMLQYVRNPHRKAEQESMPRLMLYPDRPVFKGNKTSIHEVTINSGGLHYNGPMLIPPVSRFFDFPVEPSAAFTKGTLRTVRHQKTCVSSSVQCASVCLHRGIAFVRPRQDWNLPRLRATGATVANRRLRRSP